MKSCSEFNPHRNQVLLVICQYIEQFRTIYRSLPLLSHHSTLHLSKRARHDDDVLAEQSMIDAAKEIAAKKGKQVDTPVFTELKRKKGEATVKVPVAVAFTTGCLFLLF
jgi:hypothetical protein